MPKRINPRCLIGRRAYTILELARALNVHPQTARGWKHDGLPPINPSSHHSLFYGFTVKQYFEAIKAKRQIKLGNNEFYCFGCKSKTHGVKVKSIDQGVKIGNEKQSIRLEAKCGQCGRTVCKFATLTPNVPTKPKDINISPQPSLFDSL